MSEPSEDLTVNADANRGKRARSVINMPVRMLVAVGRVIYGGDEPASERATPVAGASGVAVNADGFLVDKDGVERYPDKIRKSWWFRTVLVAKSLACLFCLWLTVELAIRGDGWGALGTGVSFAGLGVWALLAWNGIVFRS